VLQIEQQETENGTALVKLSGRLMLGPEGAQLEVVDDPRALLAHLPESSIGALLA